MGQLQKLQNNFTTVEQSKRLLELGVPANSADCYFTKSGKREIKNTALDILYTPCWSVGRLIEIYEVCLGSTYQHTSEKSLIDELLDKLPYIKKVNGVDFSKLEE